MTPSLFTIILVLAVAIVVAFFWGYDEALRVFAQASCTHGAPITGAIRRRV